MVHREMVDCFRQIGDDSDCRAVVLTGAGKIFTAGWGKYYIRYMILQMIRPPKLVMSEEHTGSLFAIQAYPSFNRNICK